MSEFELFCFAESGNAYKAALMLNLCDADWQPHYVDYLGGETRTPGFRRDVNPMGEIPVLFHGERKLAQSGVILTYLSEHFARFGGRDEQEQQEILGWLLFDNHKFTSYTATLRFMRTFTDAGETPVAAFLRERSRAAFAIVEQHLHERQFMVGAQPTIADLSLCGYLFFREQIDVDWSAHPCIDAWLARIQALPGWRHPYDLMPGRVTRD